MDWERGWMEWCEREKREGSKFGYGPDEGAKWREWLRTLPTDELVYRLVVLSGSMSYSVGTYEMREHQRLLVALDERGLSDQDKESVGALIRQVEAKWKRLEPS